MNQTNQGIEKYELIMFIERNDKEWELQIQWESVKFREELDLKQEKRHFVYNSNGFLGSSFIWFLSCNVINLNALEYDFVSENLFS